MSRYITHPSAWVVPSEIGFSYLNPAKRVSAANTPNRAPPAISPELISVPRSRRALLTASSLLRVATKYAIAPPTRIGVLSWRGMNMPRQNARAGTPSQLSNTARMAPVMYRIQGVSPPIIMGSITLAMALA